MRGVRINDAKRDKIAVAIEETNRKWTKVAKRFGVSASVVKQIAKERGLWVSAAQDASLRAATDAHIETTRALLARHAVTFAQEVGRLLDALHKPATVWRITGAGQWVQHRLPEPDSQAKQQLMISCGIALDKAAAVVGLFSGEGEQGRGAVIELVEKLRDQREQAAAQGESS